ncbi:GNAT family N-acetyltransferase [Flavobacteriaceae bacterium]|nr:GNAT family N-acetyltransferase [Flavobacteriaceae bacterium]
MIIREINNQDNDQIAIIIRKVIIEMKAPKTGTAFADPELDLLSFAFEGPRSKYFILENNGSILGGAGINSLNDYDSSFCELQKMYFLPEARGQGLGEIMMDKCLFHAIENNFKSCYIETMSFMKAAQKLYLKKGFKFINKPLGNTGHKNCNIWMLKHF